MADTPAWFNESHYLEQKAAQLNAISYEDRTDWTVEEVEAAFAEAELTAYDHFVQAGNNENVSPNPLFDAQFYLEQKAAQLSAAKHDGHANWTVEAVQYAFDQAGLTAWDHFNAHGWAEGLNPSTSFNVALYLEDKAAQLNDIEFEGRTNWTAEEVQEAFQATGLSPIAHYETAGKEEGIEPKTAADASLVELSARLDTLKAAEADVENYVGAAAFEYTNNASTVVEVEAGDATEASIELFYGDVAGQVGTAVGQAASFDGTDDDAAIQDEFISVHKALLQAEVNAAKAGQPANLETLIKAADTASDSLVAALKTANEASDEEDSVAAAFEAYHGVSLNDGTGYDAAADNSAVFYYIDGEVLKGQDGTAAPVLLTSLEVVTDDQYATNLMAAAAVLASAETAVTNATTALETAVGKVYLAVNEAYSVDADEDLETAGAIAITTTAGSEGVVIDFTADVDLNKTKADAEADPAIVTPADAEAADLLQEALEDQESFNELVDKFLEARTLNDGLVELQDARSDAGLAITNAEDDADIPGLDVDLVLVSAGSYTLGGDADVVFFTADAGNAQTISAGFTADDLIFFGKGYTFVELGDKVQGTDRLGDANVLEIFYGVDGGNTVFYVEEDAAAGIDLSGAALTTVTLTGVADALSINDALGFVGLEA